VGGNGAHAVPERPKNNHHREKNGQPKQPETENAKRKSLLGEVKKKRKGIERRGGNVMYYRPVKQNIPERDGKEKAVN